MIREDGLMKNSALRIGMAIIAIAFSQCALPHDTYAQTAKPAAKPRAAAVQKNAPEETASKPSGPPLSMEDYLGQVRGQNQAYVSALLGEQGAGKRVSEYKLLTRPSLFASYNYIDNKAETGNIITGDHFQNGAYQAGLKQTMGFGLDTKLSYNYNTVKYPSGNPTFLNPPSYITSQFLLEVNQPLLGGGFGANVQANKEQLAARALSSMFNNDWAQTQVLTSAEITYWRLALAREAVDMAQDNLVRAERLRSWSANRQKMQLADRADFLQSDSQTLQYRLNLQTALDEERVASREFNTTRGADSDEVPEQLVSFAGDVIGKLQIPDRAKYRSDVLAAEQDMKAAQAQSKLSAERNRPTLNLTGALGVNGRDASASPAIDESFTDKHPQYAIGVNFQMPLDFVTLKHSNEGYRVEERAATEAYQRKLFEQERTWNDLTHRFRESIDRYKIALQYEKAQREKLDYERTRHSRGRTTTYQVIQFEQDYSTAELARIRAKAEILNSYSQLKTFSGFAAGKFSKYEAGNGSEE